MKNDFGMDVLMINDLVKADHVKGELVTYVQNFVYKFVALNKTVCFLRLERCMFANECGTLHLELPCRPKNS